MSDAGDEAADGASLESLARGLVDRWNDRAARGAEPLADRTLQDLVTLVLQAYAERIEAGDDDAPLPPLRRDAGVTATDVVLLVTRLLQAVDVEVFELGMWQAFGRP